MTTRATSTSRFQPVSERRFWSALLLALGLSLASPAVAQQAASDTVTRAEFPVALLDQDAIFLRSLFGQRIQRDLGAERVELEAENRRIEAELIAEELALTEERGQMDPAAFAAKADDFDARVQAIRQEQDQKALDLQRQFETERQKFLSLIAPAMIEVLRETGASVLLNRDAVIFAVQGVDITDRAIATIDRLVGDGSDPAPSEGATPEPVAPETGQEPSFTAE